MPDTRRSKSTLQTSHLEDNSAKNITPQDVRDFCESVHPENTNKSGTHASQPSSDRVVGDHYWPTDGFHTARWNGTLWEAWGPIYQMTRPIDSEFSWINQGSASVDATGGGIYLSTPAAAGVTIKIRKKAAPSTPYTITAAFLYEGLFATLQQFGLCFRQSSDGKLHNFAIHRNTADLVIASYKYSSETVFSAAYSSANFTTPTPIWLRIADNGTNRICSYSCDGKHWQVFHSVGRTDFMTANEVGFYVNAENASWPIGVTLLSWKQE